MDVCDYENIQEYCSSSTTTEVFTNIVLGLKHLDEFSMERIMEELEIQVRTIQRLLEREIYAVNSVNLTLLSFVSI